MKQLEISDDEIQEAALRTKLRQDTGIDPARINKGLIEIRLVGSELRALANRPDKSPSPGRDSFDMVVSHINYTLSNLRDYLIQALSMQYMRYVPLNVALLLDTSDFAIRMDNKVGVGNFDAQVMEDQVVEMIPRFNEMVLKDILNTARAMLPNWRELKTDEMLDDSRLILHPSDTGSYEVATKAIGQLSRIVLLGEPAATGTYCQQGPSYRNSRTDAVFMATGEPIRSITFNSSEGLMAVEYDSPENARMVAEVLLDGGENEHEKD